MAAMRCKCKNRTCARSAGSRICLLKEGRKEEEREERTEGQS